MIKAADEPLQCRCARCTAKLSMLQGTVDLFRLTGPYFFASPSTGVVWASGGQSLLSSYSMTPRAGPCFRRKSDAVERTAHANVWDAAQSYAAFALPTICCRPSTLITLLFRLHVKNCSVSASMAVTQQKHCSIFDAHRQQCAINTCVGSGALKGECQNGARRQLEYQASS